MGRGQLTLSLKPPGSTCPRARGSRDLSQAPGWLCYPLRKSQALGLWLRVIRCPPGRSGALGRLLWVAGKKRLWASAETTQGPAKARVHCKGAPPCRQLLLRISAHTGVAAGTLAL